MLDGENAYFCEKCQEKRSTVKRMCIKTLPKTLVIQLKRFHYDYETNRAVKFDDYFDFPRSLEMSPYTADGIKKAEKLSRRKIAVLIRAGILKIPKAKKTTQKVLSAYYKLDKCQLLQICR